MFSGTRIFKSYSSIRVGLNLNMVCLSLLVPVLSQTSKPSISFWTRRRFLSFHNRREVTGISQGNMCGGLSFSLHAIVNERIKAKSTWAVSHSQDLANQVAFSESYLNEMDMRGLPIGRYLSVPVGEWFQGAEINCSKQYETILAILCLSHGFAFLVWLWAFQGYQPIGQTQKAERQKLWSLAMSLRSHEHKDQSHARKFGLPARTLRKCHACRCSRVWVAWSWVCRRRGPQAVKIASLWSLALKLDVWVLFWIMPCANLIQ